MKTARNTLILLVISILLGLPAHAAGPQQPANGRFFYVRQTAGDDTHDGLSPRKAWRTLSRLGDALQAGDTAFVGPGLYREMVTIAGSGTAEARITLVADTAGEHTSDPPGAVMIAGADPLDETIFVPHSAPGVYVATGLQGHSLRVVEMDGPQYRYKNARDTTEHLRNGMPELEVVASLPSTVHYDREAGALYIHTSDDRPPSTHEIELIRRSYGIVTYGSHYVSVIGFTFRHMETAGINFGKGSSHCVARNNTSYGSWQGIRVSQSSNARIEGNTVFRNGNSGVYFLSGSPDGHAVGNVAYENAKGIRWSSGSANGQALENVTFANHEVGIAIEDTDDIRVSRNALVNNAIAQLLVRKSRFTSRENCFESVGGEQLIAKIDFRENYRTLSEYLHATGQDRDAREGCGQLPRKIDVHKLHTETLAYEERARLAPAGESE